jgi:hypothetical protein
MADTDLHQRLFGFESDFGGDLRCIPMAVRRKLDLCGRKLRLQTWLSWSEERRRTLLHWPDDGAGLAGLAEALDDETTPLPPARQEPWQGNAPVPSVVASATGALGLAIGDADWNRLDELQRFALLKLSLPGHGRQNLARALAEFGLGDQPAIR